MIPVGYYPTLTVGSCKHRVSKKDCQHSGSSSLIMENLGKMYNFSIQFDVEPNNDWGALPSTGSWVDPNATFSGILELIHNNEYDLSFPEWVYIAERTHWFDFSHIVYKQEVSLFINYKTLPQNWDFTMFWRPFTMKTWICIILTALISGAMYCFLQAKYASLLVNIFHNTNKFK